MKTAVQKKPQLDRLDAEAVREMMRSRGWKLFLQRMTKLKVAKQAELEQHLDAEQTATLRGYLDAIRAVASIPDILFREGARGKAED